MPKLPNPMEKLVIDAWYKATLALSSLLLILSLVVEIRVVGNQALAAFSLGTVLLSIGEWINHPLQVKTWKPVANEGMIYKLISTNRAPSRLGTLFNLLGAAFLCLGAAALAV